MNRIFQLLSAFFHVGFQFFQRHGFIFRIFCSAHFVILSHFSVNKKNRLFINADSLVQKTEVPFHNKEILTSAIIKSIMCIGTKENSTGLKMP